MFMTMLQKWALDCCSSFMVKICSILKNPFTSILIFKVVLIKGLKEQLKSKFYIQIKDLILGIWKPTAKPELQQTFLCFAGKMYLS